MINRQKLIEELENTILFQFFNLMKLILGMTQMVELLLQTIEV